MKCVSLLVPVFLVLVVLVTGCVNIAMQATATEAAGVAAVLADIESTAVPSELSGDWTLETMNINGKTTGVSPVTPIRIFFNSPRQLGGMSGCTSYFALYSLTGSTPSRGPGLTISDAMTSKNDCTPDDMEQQYLESISRTWSYAGDGQLLTLTAENGDVLVFRKPSNRVTEVITPPVTPEPVEMAYLEDTVCTVVDEKVTTYRCLGKVRIKSGVYDEVQVMVRYPDNNAFESGVFAMGGSNPVLKSFYLFPDLKYQDQDGEWFVRLDDNRYPVIRSGNSGTAYINPPPAPVYVTLHQVVTHGIAVDPTPVTLKVTTAGKTVTGSGLSVTGIEPGTGSAGLSRYSITGSNFRQYPPPEVYLRKENSPCEYCGVHATRVEYLSPEKIQCDIDMRGPEGGPASYDVLVSNSYLADSYAVLKNGLVIR
jgi:heat shock protein HslJ